jgi:hypothetical protein
MVQETDPLFGILNSVSRKGGVWDFEEFMATPARFLEQAGLPSPQDVVPSPKELGAVIARGLPHVRMIETPPTKRILMLPAEMFASLSPFGYAQMGIKGMPNISKLLNAPIEAVNQAADAITG